MFISYVNYSEGHKVIKLKACPLIVFDSETGKYLRHAMLPAIGYANMGVIESKKLLCLIAQGENSLYLVNYQTCKDMVWISDLVNPTMFVNENLVFSNM